MALYRVYPLVQSSIGILAMLNCKKYKIINYIVELQVKVVMNWFNVNVVTKHALATCLTQHVVS